MENCSLCTASLKKRKKGFQKERKVLFLLSLSSDMGVVREHYRCFIAYKCGIVLQRIEALQGTVSTKADVCFVWVSSVFTHWIALLPLVLPDFHRLRLSQTDNE